MRTCENHSLFSVLIAFLCTGLTQVAAQTPLPNMVWIGPGTFNMGSPLSEAARGTDESQHAVTLTGGFYMAKFEVTQMEYVALAGSNPSYFNTNHGYALDLMRPVENVSWDDAIHYCNLLTQRELAVGHISSDWIYRLPTEAEWEYACRAGTSTAFSFGDAIHGGMANFYNYKEYDASSGNMTVSSPSIPYIGATTNVGQYFPNTLGLYDMHGNVWEWCSDWYGDYPTGITIDPRGPALAEVRVLRGGVWNDYGVYCRSGLAPIWRTVGVRMRHGFGFS